MFRYSCCILLLISVFVQSQSDLSVQFLKKTSVDWDHFVGVDPFDALYYIKNQSLVKDNNGKVQQYSNLQLGAIDHVNIFNTLKIVVHYKDFNSVVLLDNRLAEINIVSFNEVLPFRDITAVSYANENTLWLYNAITLQLELFDYDTQNTQLKSLPIEDEPHALAGDYNNVFALTPSTIYHYNYTGSIIQTIAHQGFDKFQLNNDRLFLKKDNALYCIKSNSSKITPIKIPKILVKQFFVMNQTLYIYDGEFLHYYQLLNN